MKKLLAICLSLCCLSLVCGEEAGSCAVKAKVSADKLNLRVKPGLGRSVVAILSLGDELEVKSLDGDWLAVAAPKSSAVWVAKCFVADGVLKKGAILRAGPGVAYEPFGTAPAQEPVTVVDATHEYWLRIEAPSWLVGYTSLKYVKLPPGAEAKLRVASGKPDSKTAAPPATESSPVVVEPSVEEQFKKDVVVEGTLLPVNDSRKIATHALAAQVNGDYHTLCYLRSTSFNLQLWEGRKVRVKGVQRWAGDWRRPLVDIELVTPLWQ